MRTLTSTCIVRIILQTEQNRIMKIYNLYMYSLHYITDTVKCHYEEFNFYKGIDAIMDQLRHTNTFVQNHKPWEVRKQPDQQEWLDTMLCVVMETLRVSGVLLQPVVPNISDRLLTRLNVSNRTFKCVQEQNFTARKLNPMEGVLLQRIKL